MFPVAALEKKENTRLMADELTRSKDLTPTIIKNLQDTWYLITVSRQATKS